MRCRWQTSGSHWFPFSKCLRASNALISPWWTAQTEPERVLHDTERISQFIFCLFTKSGGKRNVQAPSMHLSNVQFFAFIVTVLLQFLFYLKRTGAQSRWNKAVWNVLVFSKIFFFFFPFFSNAAKYNRYAVRFFFFFFNVKSCAGPAFLH